MNNGDLSAIRLEDIMLSVGELVGWEGNYEASFRRVNTTSLEALGNTQTADFSILQDQVNRNNKKVIVEWFQMCDLETEDCTDATCDDLEAGVEVGAMSQELTIDDCVQAASFSIDEAKLRDKAKLGVIDQQIRDWFFNADKAIAEKWSVKWLTHLDGIAYPNALAFDGSTPAAANGECTELSMAILSDPWNYFSFFEGANNYTRPIFLGGQFFSKYAMDAARENGFKGYGMVDIMGYTHYVDQNHFDPTISPLPADPKKLYAFEAGNFAYANYYEYPDFANRQEKGFRHWAYRWRSPILSAIFGRDIFHDVEYQVVCKNNRNFHTWKIVNKGDIFTAPEDCGGAGRVHCFTCA